MRGGKSACNSYFNPRPPRGGRRCVAYSACCRCKISIHAPRQGGDPVNTAGTHRARDFNPRPPRGGRQNGGGGLMAARKFQSTPPARGATIQDRDAQQQAYISIHAPREGGDKSLDNITNMWDISIHAPREGGDLIIFRTACGMGEFQSTSPARGATP